MPIEPTYDERGLVPCVVQDAEADTVLMLAWMNAEALRLTRATGVVHFWSRSRQALWKKGETSGHTLAVVELRVDCDRDAVLVRARPAGPTCHTGRTSCFYHRDLTVGDAAATAAATAAAAAAATDPAAEPAADPDAAIDDGPAPPILLRLERIIHDRRAATATKSYTKSLLEAGLPKILAKIAEEHGELAAELPAGPPDKIVHETADLLYHVLVGLAARDVPLAAVLGELSRRFGTGGHVEKARRTPAP